MVWMDRRISRKMFDLEMLESWKVLRLNKPALLCDLILYFLDCNSEFTWISKLSYDKNYDNFTKISSIVVEYRPLLLELFTIRHAPVTAIAKCPTIYSSPYPK